MSTASIASSGFEGGRDVAGRTFNWARLAGFAYLGVVVFGIFAEMVVRDGLIVAGDAATTAANIVASEQLYRFGLLSDLAMLLAYVLMALAFWELFKPVNRSVSLLAAFLNLIAATIIGINLIFHVGALLLLGDGGMQSAFQPDQSQALAMLFLELHRHGYLIAQLFFGTWCLVIGYLVYTSGFLPKILGILLGITFVAQMVEMVVAFVFPEMEAVIGDYAMAPAAIGELALCLWLVVMGGRVHRGWLQAQAA